MATHSSTLAWKIPWMEEPGRLQFMGSLRVGHYWATSVSLFTLMHWRRKWQPTPVFLPGESQGRGSLVGCRLWGLTESNMTEVTAAAAAVTLYFSLRYICLIGYIWKLWKVTIINLNISLIVILNHGSILICTLSILRSFRHNWYKDI